MNIFQEYNLEHKRLVLEEYLQHDFIYIMLTSMRNKDRYYLGIKYDAIIKQGKEMEQFLDSAYEGKRWGGLAKGMPGALMINIFSLFLALGSYTRDHCLVILSTLIS